MPVPKGILAAGAPAGGNGIVSFNRDLLLRPASGMPRKSLALKRRKSVNPDGAEHLMIEGDNLEALKILHKSHVGSVSVIYIDPPYNTMKERMYSDKSSHANWVRMMYPRLYLARRLLSDRGVMFVSIGTDEVHHLRLMLDDLFGEENMISEVVWNSKYTVSNDSKFISTQHEYVLVYARDKGRARFNLLPRTEKADGAYRNPDGDPRGGGRPPRSTQRAEKRTSGTCLRGSKGTTGGGSPRSRGRPPPEGSQGTAPSRSAGSRGTAGSRAAGTAPGRPT